MLSALKELVATTDILSVPRTSYVKFVQPSVWDQFLIGCPDTSEPSLGEQASQESGFISGFDTMVTLQGCEVYRKACDSSHLLIVTARTIFAVLSG